MVPNGVWSLPDLMIVALFFVLFATLGLLIPRLGYRLAGRMANEPETRLVDRTQRGLRAFLVFLLALTLNDVREKFVRMDGEASREASEIKQLHRLLEIDGSIYAKRERELLRDYAGAIAEDEWKSLGAKAPMLSARADEILAELRRLAKRSAMNSPHGEGSGLWTGLIELEDLRQARLQKAQSSTAPLFWIVIGLMTFLECLMTTESNMSLRRKVTLGGYYGCLGMIVALILIFERPFSGATRLSAEPFRQVATLSDQ
ncbi:MAG: DUF4239 domain-containing protein [Verrucomicrobia bacterium]|nr:DUF4239 domain-containing protein [Verrucomicrobiota bacterium]